MKIQPKALELIAKYMGDYSSGYELLQFLKDCEVPQNLIVYPNTKWRMLYDIFYALSNSSDKKDYDILLKIISKFLHPLNFEGDEEKAQDALNKFRGWLKYDKLTIDFQANEIAIFPQLSYRQVQENEELFEDQVDSDTGQALHLLKEEHLEDLILLKKAYQLLLNIVNTFFLQNCHPTEKLNESYLKICRIIANSNNNVFNDPELKEFNLALLPNANVFWRPFNNLFGAEAQYNGLYNEQRLDIWRRMNDYYGKIVQVCFDCEAGDILAKSDKQKLLNEVSLYLSELKEKRQQSEKEAVQGKNTKSAWRDDFKWEGNTFIFGDFGSIPFDSSTRKNLFKALTDNKGNWVSITDLQQEKDANYVRATIRQIETRLIPSLKKCISIPSTQDDDLEPKPSQGAYRIKFAA